MKHPFAELLPQVPVPPPGPRSRALMERLARVECPDTTFWSDAFPIFWERAAGANVWDADGNRYVDLTSAFGVCSIGHTHPEVMAAIREQSGRLVHAMGDVHPSELKARVGEALARLAPGDLDVSLFGGSGSEAVEAALKTAALATGRPGCLAFEGAYHGLSYGALAVTWRDDFRSPFAAQLNAHVVHLPYPETAGCAPESAAAAQSAARSLERVDALLSSEAGAALGAVIVEPIQGRGGVRVPHRSFLAGLREICTRRGRLLVSDEILTGLGRTGDWFACEHSKVVPDLLCVGKSLAGGLPLSACIGSAGVMSAWGRSNGEARHTSTFLGNPLACAASLANLEILLRDAPPQSVAARGSSLGARLATLLEIPGVAGVRGRGMLWGLELVQPSGAPDAARAFGVVLAAMQSGVLLLADGTHRNVLAVMPPFCLADAQRDAALDVLRAALESTGPQAAPRRPAADGSAPTQREAGARGEAPRRAASRVPGDFDAETRRLDESILDWITVAPPGFQRAGASRGACYGLDDATALASERRFESLALDLFVYQYERIAAYRAYAQRLGRTPSRLRLAAEVPALPVEAFQRDRIASFPPAFERARFETSGTSTGRRGTLHLDTLELYDAALARGFRHHVLPDRDRMRMLQLVPSVAEAPRSSLAYMLDRVSRLWGAPRGGVFVRDGALRWAELQAALREAAGSREPVCLLGTAFAWAHVLDACDTCDWTVELPPGSRLLETGGFKGQSRELERAVLYRSLEARLGIPVSHMVSEYGMTEMASQCYTLSLRHALLGESPPIDDSWSFPAWLRPRLVDSESGASLDLEAATGPGLVAQHDLANRSAPAHLLTADLGFARGCSFELRGRVARAERRGCGLPYETLQRAAADDAGAHA